MWGVFLLVVGQCLGFVQDAGAWTRIEPNAEGWGKKELVITLNPEKCTIPEEVLLPALERSASIWNGVADISLRVSREFSRTTVPEFMEGDADDSPVVLCDDDFARRHGVDPLTVPAVTRVSSDDGFVNYGAVFLNVLKGTGSEISQLNDEQLQLALSHEIGHILGFGHSQDPNALMYYTIAGKSELRLGEDDLKAMQELYPANRVLHAGPGGCAASHQKAGGDLGMLIYIAILFSVTKVGGRIYARRLQFAEAPILIP